MTIYLVLLGYTVMVPIIVNSIFKDIKNRHNFTAFFSVLGIYLVLALKKYTVGIDIPGYYEEYKISAGMAIDSYEYVYFEKGYTFLQKLFARNGVSFQVFTAVIYGIICMGLFLFIKKYSKNVTISALIFICYQFLLFTVTGLRQALAMGVCMIAFVVMDTPENSAKWAKILRGILAFLLVYLAYLFHESAAIFVVILILYLMNKNITGLSYVPYIILVIMARLIQPFVIEIINEMFKSDQEAEITLGLNFVFLIVLVIAIIVCYYIEPKDTKLLKRQGIEIEKPSAFYGLCIRILLVGIAFYIMLSGSTLLRGATYFTLFLIPAVPNAINRLDKGEKVLVNIVFAVFLMIFFYMNALKPATFKICPYEFFWQ